MIFHHVKTEGDNEVGVVNSPRNAVLAAEAHRVQAVVRIHVDTALRHERTDDTDAGLFAERSQLLACTFADAAVAGKDNGPLRLFRLIRPPPADPGPACLPDPES